MPVKAKLNSIHATLPPAERKVADFILSDPDRAMHMTISELASSASVSLPSVTRLARKLGYSGFSDFKVALASGSANVAKGGAQLLRNDDSDEVFIHKLMLGQLRAIESTLLTLDKSKLCSLAEAISKARRIVFFSSVDNLDVLYGINQTLLHMGLDSAIMNDPACMINYASFLREGDVFFGFSRTGLTQRTLECLRAAKECGAATAFMSNLINSTASKIADYFFCTSRLEEIYRYCGLETNGSGKALMEVLTLLIARKLGKIHNGEHIDLLIGEKCSHTKTAFV